MLQETVLLGIADFTERSGADESPCERDATYLKLDVNGFSLKHPGVSTYKEVRFTDRSTHLDTVISQVRL